MSLPKINPTQTKAWQKLQAHFNDIKDIKMTTLFAKDSGRSEQLRIIWDDFFVDYSKNRLTPKTLQLLNDLAEELHLDQAINAQFKGEVINETENRKVLHTALRALNNEQLLVDNADIVHKISEVKGKIQSFTDAVVSGENKGYTGKPFTDIVNVGVGGSDLGPSMVVESLQYYKNHLNIHPVKWIDQVLEYALETMPKPVDDKELATAVSESEKDTKAAITH